MASGIPAKDGTGQCLMLVVKPPPPRTIASGHLA